MCGRSRDRFTPRCSLVDRVVDNSIPYREWWYVVPVLFFVLLEEACFVCFCICGCLLWVCVCVGARVRVCGPVSEYVHMWLCGCLYFLHDCKCVRLCVCKALPICYWCTFYFCLLKIHPALGWCCAFSVSPIVRNCVVRCNSVRVAWPSPVVCLAAISPRSPTWNHCSAFLQVSQRRQTNIFQCLPVWEFAAPNGWMMMCVCLCVWSKHSIDYSKIQELLNKIHSIIVC